MDRAQVGVRFQPDLWANYKRSCQVQDKRPNELLEATMKAAVDSGDVRASIDAMSIQSEGGEELVATVLARKLLLEIDELVDHGYWMIFRHEEAGNLLPDEQDKEAPYPELAPAIEKTIEQLLPSLKGLHDKAPLAQAKRSLERAQAYIRDFERITDADYDYAKDEFVESSFTRKEREEHKSRVVLQEGPD